MWTELSVTKMLYSPFLSPLPTNTGYFHACPHPEAWGFFFSSFLFNVRNFFSIEVFLLGKCSHSWFPKCALESLFPSRKIHVKVWGPKGFLRVRDQVWASHLWRRNKLPWWIVSLPWPRMQPESRAGAILFTHLQIMTSMKSKTQEAFSEVHIFFWF